MRADPTLRVGRLALAAVGAFFFVSGASALVYQVAWQRILALHSGVGIYSIAMIVAAFMAGLGLGSRWGGVLSTRVPPQSALVRFALLELGIAALGAVSVPVYYDWLYLRAAWLYAPSWRAALLHFAVLLPPTALMGMSLPFLVRAVVAEAQGAGRRIGFLYGINMLGAAVGALLAPWVLIRHVDQPEPDDLQRQRAAARERVEREPQSERAAGGRVGIPRRRNLGDRRGWIPGAQREGEHEGAEVDPRQRGEPE